MAGDGDAADGSGGGVRGAGTWDGGRRRGAPPAGLVVDAFVGVGGNSIQFAARGCYMVVVEIDPRKVELAVHNARIYGVEDRIEFIVGDFFRLAPFLKADLVFLSPPWGGPSYNQTPIYTLDMLKPKDGYAIFQAAQGIAPNIVMFLPRNVDIRQVEELTCLSSPPLDFEVGCTSGRVEHEVSTSKIGEDQVFYFQQRGIDHEKAVAMMIGGFCKAVFDHPPLEFAQEVGALMNLKLEGSVG